MKTNKPWPLPEGFGTEWADHVTVCFRLDDVPILRHGTGLPAELPLSVVFTGACIAHVETDRKVEILPCVRGIPYSLSFHVRRESVAHKWELHVDGKYSVEYQRRQALYSTRWDKAFSIDQATDAAKDKMYTDIVVKVLDALNAGTYAAEMVLAEINRLQREGKSLREEYDAAEIEQRARREILSRMAGEWQALTGG